MTEIARASSGERRPFGQPSYHCGIREIASRVLNIAKIFFEEIAALVTENWDSLRYKAIEIFPEGLRSYLAPKASLFLHLKSRFPDQDISRIKEITEEMYPLVKDSSLCDLGDKLQDFLDFAKYLNRANRGEDTTTGALRLIAHLGLSSMGLAKRMDLWAAVAGLLYHIGDREKAIDELLIPKLNQFKIADLNEDEKLRIAYTIITVARQSVSKKMSEEEQGSVIDQALRLISTSPHISFSFVEIQSLVTTLIKVPPDAREGFVHEMNHARVSDICEDEKGEKMRLAYVVGAVFVLTSSGVPLPIKEKRDLIGQVFRLEKFCLEIDSLEDAEGFVRSLLHFSSPEKRDEMIAALPQLGGFRKTSFDEVIGVVGLAYEKGSSVFSQMESIIPKLAAHEPYPALLMVILDRLFSNPNDREKAVSYLLLLLPNQGSSLNGVLDLAQSIHDVSLDQREAVIQKAHSLIQSLPSLPCVGDVGQVVAALGKLSPDSRQKVSICADVQSLLQQIYAAEHIVSNFQ